VAPPKITGLAYLNVCHLELHLAYVESICVNVIFKPNRKALNPWEVSTHAIFNVMLKDMKSLANMLAKALVSCLEQKF